ncbi:MAG: ATP:cob(I)alamin adenosyltransferase [Candidatus Shapirobacteria bacterium]
MITTKKGDKGQTTCGDKRVDKDNLLVEVIGTIDELQSVLELIGGETEIVDDLSQIMGVVGCGTQVEIIKKVWGLEKKMEKLEEKLPELKQFLRFKNKEALNLNWARTICRRLERRVVSLSKIEKIEGEILIYFNRLSDYLFLRAREEEIK